MTSGTVIMIEDNPQLITLFENIFRHNEMRIIAIGSRDAPTLPECVQIHQPYMVFIDNRIYRRHREAIDGIMDSLTPHVPTTLLSSVDDRQLTSTFDYVLKKPFTIDHLLSIIAERR